MAIVRFTYAALLIAAVAFGQAMPAPPQFEVASIRPVPPLGQAQVNVGIHIDGAQVRCTALSLKDYISSAYRVKIYQVSGPDWLASARFDIAAKLPAGASGEKIPEMLQALLAERFGLKLHRETKDFPVYALIQGKGALKLKESESGAESNGRRAVDVTATGGPGGTTVNFGGGSYFSFGDNRFEGHKLTMTAFADTLARFTDRPVVDMTELKGAYDFVLELSPEDYRAMLIRSAINAGVQLPPQALQLLEGASGDSLLNAVQMVGLRLESRKAPLEVLVIDRIEKAPTEN